MFHIGMWMLPVVGIPLILLLIWMYFLARRRSRRLAESRGGRPRTAGRSQNDRKD